MAHSGGRSASFFEGMAWIFLLLVIAGFGSLQLMMPEQTSAMRPTLLTHTALFLAWYVLLVLQPRLIASRNITLHRRIGAASVALAIAMFVAGCVVIREAYLRPGWSIAGMSPQASTMFPVSDMIFFPLAYTLAIVNRRKGDAHKRYMLFAGMVMLDPALARLVAAFGLFPPVIMGIELALVASVIVYDRKTLGRVHPATWFGAGLIVLTYPLVFVVAQTGAWAGLVTSVLGSPPV